MKKHLTLNKEELEILQEALWWGWWSTNEGQFDYDSDVFKQLDTKMGELLSVMNLTLELNNND